MTTSRDDTDIRAATLLFERDVTVKDVERLDNLQRIFGDPRRRVEVSQVPSEAAETELPASSRFQISAW